MNVTIWTADHTRGDAGVDVVGEQYHAGAVELFKRHAGASSAPAILMRQPDNPKDSNAIGVMVYTQDDPPQAALVGYLTRDDAAAYRPLLEYIGNRVLGCEAAVAPYRGGGGTDGVVLHLGTPGELVANLWIEEHGTTDHAWVGKTVAFSGFGISLAGVTLDAAGQALLARLAGCSVVPRVTKKVDVCVFSEGSEHTTNVEKARQYGIELVPEADFWVGLGVAGDSLSTGLGRWAQPAAKAWAP